MYLEGGQCPPALSEDFPSPFTDRNPVRPDVVLIKPLWQHFSLFGIGQNTVTFLCEYFLIMGQTRALFVYVHLFTWQI